MPKIVLTIDVEDWFNVRNMAHLIPFKDWERQELRVGEGMGFILEELQKRNIRATFFILGWIAERCPDLVKRISDLGHEIASHGFSHRPLDWMTPQEFRSELRQSIDILEGFSGRRIKGHRAPSFSITRKTFWALKIIREEGLVYDSSIFPIRHPDYGIPDYREDIHQIQEGPVEIPMRNFRWGPFSLPIAGGGYFRILPFWITQWGLRKALKKNDVIMYFHPWEFDHDQPRVGLTGLKKWRHYTGLLQNRKKFLRLLDKFEFKKMDELLPASNTVL